MENVRLRSLIGTDRSDLDAKLGVACTSSDKGISDDSHRVISFGDNQEPYELLVPIDYEVPTQFLGLLFPVDQFGGCALLQVTLVAPEHNRHLSQITHCVLPVSIVDPIIDPRPELATVARMSFATLAGIDVSVFGAELVIAWQDRLLQEDIPDPDGQPVFLAQRSPFLLSGGPLLRCFIGLQ